MMVVVEVVTAVVVVAMAAAAVAVVVVIVVVLLARPAGSRCRPTLLLLSTLKAVGPLCPQVGQPGVGSGREVWGWCGGPAHQRLHNLRFVRVDPPRNALQIHTPPPPPPALPLLGWKVPSDKGVGGCWRLGHPRAPTTQLRLSRQHQHRNSLFLDSTNTTTTSFSTAPTPQLPLSRQHQHHNYLFLDSTNTTTTFLSSALRPQLPQCQK